MNTNENTKKINYTNIDRTDMRYFGIHKIDNRLHIDIERYKNILEEDIHEFLPDNLIGKSFYFIGVMLFSHAL